MTYAVTHPHERDRLNALADSLEAGNAALAEHNAWLAAFTAKLCASGDPADSYAIGDAVTYTDSRGMPHEAEVTGIDAAEGKIDVLLDDGRKRWGWESQVKRKEQANG